MDKCEQKTGGSLGLWSQGFPRKVTDWQGGMEERGVKEASAARTSSGLCSRDKL